MKVEVKLFTQQDGRKSFTGVLTDFDGDRITVDEGARISVIEKSEIAKLKTI